ncbi:MAG: hypothetical protein ACK4HR_02830 [Hyphomonas sp.]
MTRLIRSFLPLVLIAGLSGCHTDPFGLKPEVRGVEIPDQTGKPVSSGPEKTEDEPESASPAPG